MLFNKFSKRWVQHIGVSILINANSKCSELRQRLRVVRRVMSTATAILQTTQSVILKQCIVFILLSYLSLKCIVISCSCVCLSRLTYCTYCSVIKSFNLPGVLPINIVKLPYLQEMWGPLCSYIWWFMMSTNIMYLT